MKKALCVANFCGRVCLVLCLLVVIVQPVFAYDDPPMRVARLNYVEGRVSFQPGGESDWGWATLNRPLTAGDSLWTGNRSRAELHIGSTAIRVSGQTSVSFLNLDDRTVQVQLNSGTINVRVRNLYRDDVFEVDTPNLAFTLLRRGDYRITVDPDGRFTTITLRDGQGQVNGGGQAFLVDGGSQVQVSGTDYISYDIYDLPGRDSFDQWSRSRELREGSSRSARYVSPELTGSEDLDRNGTWRTDRTYGQVWVPTRVSRDWAPYKDGHWAWVDPWGWTWVDNAPAGFVTSHYGRWAHVDGGYGGGGWVWVPPHRDARQDASAQRPAYSPALVTFVGDSNSSRDFGNSGGVAWVPLAPGEVYVPAHQTSPTYITNVNVTNTVVQQTTITNVVNNNVQTTTYANQRVAGAVTAVPRATFVNAQPVAQAAVVVAPSAITVAPAVHTAPVAPVRASVMGANRAGAANASAAAAPPMPPPAVVSRPVVAKVAPPPPPVAFAQKQQALQANPGRPLDARAEQNLRAATPPPVERVVKTAPPAPAVKPVETAAKKPQPATSLNTAQQVHPPAPGAPPAGAGAQQTTQQQLAEEKAKQQAAQQQAAAEKAKQEAAQQQAAQQAAAEKAKQQTAQQQAAAEKAKQEAAQQQAAQQAAAEKTKQEAARQQVAQQQVAAEKAKQEAAQQQAAQQAAAEKTKQEAAQQQAAQQAAAEKTKQEAARQQVAQQQVAAEKAKQEAAQQQAAQQAAVEKTKQEATRQQVAQQQAAAEKAKQETAQQQAAQQAAAEKTKQEAARQQVAQQQAAAEKAKQEAAQQQAAQQAAAEKTKQEAAQQQAAQQAAAEKTKQEAARQQVAQQQAAAEKAKQEAAQQQAAQQAAAEKTKQEAAQQQAAQQAAAEKTKQEAARQQVAQQQVAAEKAKQEAAQQQAAAEKAKQEAARLQTVAEKTKQEAAQQQTAERARQRPPTEDRPPSNPNARPPRGAPPADQPPAANNGPVRVAENVQAAKLISQPKLNYPADAKAAHVQGTVRVHVLIGSDGKVKSATVVSGPQRLQAAALENARQRQYQPTLVGGKPVEVETEISIEF
jgi:TonB family protein